MAAVAALCAAAACGDDDDDGGGDRHGTEPTTAATTAPAATAVEPVTLRLGVLPQRHPRPGHHRRRGRASSPRPRARTSTSSSSRSTRAPRPSRRCSPTPSTPASSGPTRPSTASPSPTARPCASSPAPRRAAPPSSSARASTAPDDLAGTTLATPSLGNTQDVALRAWLTEQGYRPTPAAVATWRSSRRRTPTRWPRSRPATIDGAWVPEPWATRLVNEGGGHVLVDERDLWPDGEFVTTHLIVATDYLEEHPDVVERPDRRPGRGDRRRQRRRRRGPGDRQRRHRAGHDQAASPTRRSPARGRTSTFTLDPIASSLQESADDAVEVGLLDPVDLDGHLRPRRSSTRCSPSAARRRSSGAVTASDQRSAASPRPSDAARRRRHRAADVDLDVARGEFVCLVGASGLRQEDAAQPRSPGSTSRPPARSRSPAGRR